MKVTKLANTYLAFGTSVSADFSLFPCEMIARGSRKSGSIRARLAKEKVRPKGPAYHSFKNQDGTNYARFYRVGHGYCIVFANQGTFLLSRTGKEIRCSFSRSHSDSERAVVFLHHVLPFALALNGKHVVHAAAFSRNGKGQIVVAGPGTGKSTLAKSLSAQGFEILSDDAVVIERTGKRYYIRPSTPLIRLWSKRDQSKLIYFETEKPKKKRVPLVAIHFPSLRKSGMKSFTHALGPAAVMEGLLPEIFRVELEAPDALRNEFTFISELSSHVRGYAWSHRHTPAALTRARNLLVRAEKGVLA